MHRRDILLQGPVKFRTGGDGRKAEPANPRQLGPIR